LGRFFLFHRKPVHVSGAAGSGRADVPVRQHPGFAENVRLLADRRSLFPEAVPEPVHRAGDRPFRHVCVLRIHHALFSEYGLAGCDGDVPHPSDRGGPARAGGADPVFCFGFFRRFGAEFLPDLYGGRLSDSGVRPFPVLLRKRPGKKKEDGFSSGRFGVPDHADYGGGMASVVSAVPVVRAHHRHPGKPGFRQLHDALLHDASDPAVQRRRVCRDRHLEGAGLRPGDKGPSGSLVIDGRPHLYRAGQQDVAYGKLSGVPGPLRLYPCLSGADFFGQSDFRPERVRGSSFPAGDSRGCDRPFSRRLHGARGVYADHLPV